MSAPINVGVYEEFPALVDALEWLETYTAEGNILSSPPVWENASSAIMNSKVRTKSKYIRK